MCYSVAQGEANVVVGRNNAFTHMDDSRIRADYGGSDGPPPPPVVDTPAISLNKPATMSSQSLPNTNNYPASMVNDGIKTGVNNFNHTIAELKPWIQIDLGASYKITKTEIVNRTGCSQCVGRLKKFRVTVTDYPVLDFPQAGYLFQYTNDTGAKDGEVITSPATATGRYVRLWVENATPNYLHLAELSVWGTPTTVNCRDTIYKIARDSVGKVCR